MITIEQFIDTPSNWARAKRKPCVVKFYIPTLGTVVYNKFDEAYYKTSEDKVGVLLDSMGGERTISVKEVCKDYRFIDGCVISAPELSRMTVNGKLSPINIVPKGEMELFGAIRIPVREFRDMHYDAITGERYSINHSGIEHGMGDVVMCRLNLRGLPDLSDLWVVNGMVFDAEYAIV